MRVNGQQYTNVDNWWQLMGNTIQMWTPGDNSGQVWTTGDNSGQVWTTGDNTGPVWTSGDSNWTTQQLQPTATALPLFNWFHKSVSDIKWWTLKPHRPLPNQGKILKNQPVSLTGSSIREQGAPIKKTFLSPGSSNSDSGLKQLWQHLTSVDNWWQ